MKNKNKKKNQKKGKRKNKSSSVKFQQAVGRPNQDVQAQ